MLVGSCATNVYLFEGIGLKELCHLGVNNLEVS